MVRCGNARQTLVARASLSGYVAAEQAGQFTVPMLFARLVVGRSQFGYRRPCLRSGGRAPTPMAVSMFAVVLVLFFPSGALFLVGAVSLLVSLGVPGPRSRRSCCWVPGALRGYFVQVPAVAA